MSQVLSSIKYICSRKTLGSNTGTPDLFLAPDPSYPLYARSTFMISVQHRVLEAKFKQLNKTLTQGHFIGLIYCAMESIS